MAEPISSDKDPNDEEGKVSKDNGDESAVDKFHRKNRRRKQLLIQRMAQRAAREAGGQIAEETGLKDKIDHLVDQFVGWLKDIGPLF